MSAPEGKQPVTVVFGKPVRPGTPQAQAEGCLCRFESNLAAAFAAAEHGYDDMIVVIHEDCPVHKIIRKPMDDVLGTDAG